MSNVSIKDNLAVVKQQLRQAATAAGRSPKDIQLIAVSKTKPAEMIYKAVLGNHTVFGKVCSDDDQKIVDTIAQDDQIQSIEIMGENEFDESVINRIKEWDAILEKYMI